MTESTKSKPDTDTVIGHAAEPLDASRRKLLKAGAAGLIAGVATPMLGGQSSALAAEKQNGKILIAYYSRTGNTREVANQIQQRVGGELSLRLVSALVVAYGVKASFDRNLPAKLIAYYSFDFWSFEESTLGFFAGFLYIMGIFVGLTHYALKWQQKRAAL